MSPLAEWQHANQEYLAAALQWLRLRLTRYAERDLAPMVTVPGDPVGAPALTVTDAQVAEAAAAMAAAESADPPPALLIIEERFGLLRFERDVLLLCAAMELDPATADLCARAHRDRNRPHPTFGLALSIFDDPVWDAVSPERPLRYWRLIETASSGWLPLTASALRADERFVNFLKGLNHRDDRLAPLLVAADDAGDSELPPSQQAAVDAVVRHLTRTPSASALPAINLAGADAGSKRLVAAHAAAALGLRVYRLPAEVLPSPAAELDALARLCEREELLMPIALYVDAHSDQASESEARTPPLHRFLSRTSGVVFLDTRDVAPPAGRHTVIVDVARPTAAEQRAAWTARLGGGSSELAAQLAAQFDLDLSTIARLASTSDTENLWEACLRSTRPRLENLAQRLEIKAKLDQVVLPAAEKRLLQQIADQVRSRTRVYEEFGFGNSMNRGRSITVLFAGESGTGKTMAAEAMAQELRLDLYRIDLSGVLDKYIGETEKKLRQLFDAAESGGAILFFDEADALFGKRSEVKDSHDRFANIQIDYLLQRVEAYHGLAILATNMKSALDQAFTRRLRFIVNFPHPGAAERREIWKKVFPPETKTAGLDFERLARLDVTGGAILNIALNAAFLAARTKDATVTMPLILDAARTELQKMDRLINEAHFRWSEPAAEKIA
ncbi:MAG: ATP-binding protein [Acidobacteriota bacterium]